jgi:hypothetical protein
MHKHTRAARAHRDAHARSRRARWQPRAPSLRHSGARWHAQAWAAGPSESRRAHVPPLRVAQDYISYGVSHQWLQSSWAVSLYSIQISKSLHPYKPLFLVLGRIVQEMSSFYSKDFLQVGDGSLGWGYQWGYGCNHKEETTEKEDIYLIRPIRIRGLATSGAAAVDRRLDSAVTHHKAWSLLGRLAGGGGGLRPGSSADSES